MSPVCEVRSVSASCISSKTSKSLTYLVPSLDQNIRRIRRAEVGFLLVPRVRSKQGKCRFTPINLVQRAGQVSLVRMMHGSRGPLELVGQPRKGVEIGRSVRVGVDLRNTSQHFGMTMRILNGYIELVWLTLTFPLITSARTSHL